MSGLRIGGVDMGEDAHHPEGEENASIHKNNNGNQL